MKENNIGPYVPYLGTPYRSDHTGLEIIAHSGYYYARDLKSGKHAHLDPNNAWLLSWFISTEGMISADIISQAMMSRNYTNSHSNIRTNISRLNGRLKLLGEYNIKSFRKTKNHNGYFQLITPKMDAI